MASMKDITFGVLLVFSFSKEIVAKDILYNANSAHMPNEKDLKYLHYDAEPVCVDSLCYSQDECCPGTACMTHGDAKVGVCAKFLGQPEGKLCTVASGENQCFGDLECKPIHVSVLPLGACVNHNKIGQQKKFYESCETTMDCDTSAKLCCRILTPAKGKNRKVCSYYDALLEQCVF